MDEEIRGGAFQVARQIFESELWLEKPSSWKVIWIYILGKVNHKDNGKFKRGEGYFNFRQHKNLIGNDITTDMIKKFCHYARTCEMIDTKRSTRGLVIKVINYDKFQTLSNFTSTKSSTSQAPAKHQPSTPINKNDKNVKNDKNNTNTPPDGVGLEVNNLISLFKAVNPAYEQLFRRPNQRQAIERLLPKFGSEKLTQIINFLPKSNATKYAPTITTPLQLEAKMGELAAFTAKERSAQKEVFDARQK